MAGGEVAGRPALITRYAGPPLAANARKEEKAAYKGVSAAAEHLIQGCASPGPGARKPRPEAEVIACVDAYIDGGYQPRHPLSRKGRSVVIDAKIFGRLKEVRLKARRDQSSAEAETSRKSRDEREEGVLKDALECELLQIDSAALSPGMFGNSTLRLACFRQRRIPLPAQAGECIDLKGFKLYKSWYDYDYSSQYARFQACKEKDGGISTRYRYLRAPLPAVLGAVGFGALRTTFFKLSMGATATRVVPMGVTLRVLASIAAFAAGWCVGKVVDEGVGTLTSRKLSDHIGLSLGEKAPAPKWMMKAYDWVGNLF